jgi:hypothetical protein
MRWAEPLAVAALAGCHTAAPRPEIENRATGTVTPHDVQLLFTSVESTNQGAHREIELECKPLPSTRVAVYDVQREKLEIVNLETVEPSETRPQYSARLPPLVRIEGDMLLELAVVVPSPPPAIMLARLDTRDVHTIDQLDVRTTDRFEASADARAFYVDDHALDLDADGRGDIGFVDFCLDKLDADGACDRSVTYAARRRADRWELTPRCYDFSSSICEELLDP